MKTGNITAATYDQLVANLVGATEEFIERAESLGLSVEEAQEAWMEELVWQRDVANRQAAAAERRAAPDEGTLVASFEIELERRMKAGQSRRTAVCAIARTRPDLHRAYLIKANTDAGRTGVVARLRAEALRSATGNGAETTSTDDGQAGPATERWTTAVEAEMAKGKSNRQAVLALEKQRPGLREAYLAEYNARHSANR